MTRDNGRVKGRWQGKRLDFYFFFLSGWILSASYFLFPKHHSHRACPEVGRTSFNTRTFRKGQEPQINGNRSITRGFSQISNPLSLAFLRRYMRTPLPRWPVNHFGKNRKGEKKYGGANIYPKGLSDLNNYLKSEGAEILLLDMISLHYFPCQTEDGSS